MSVIRTDDLASQVAERDDPGALGGPKSGTGNPDRGPALPEVGLMPIMCGVLMVNVTPLLQLPF